MVSRQSFSQYLQSHQPNAREYADIQRLAEGAQYKFNLLDDCWKTHLLTPVIQPLLFPLTTIWTTFTHDPNATLADTLNQTLALGQMQVPKLIPSLIEIGILNKRTPELKDPTSPQAISKIFRVMGATAAPITDPTLEILIPKITQKTVTTISNAKEDLAATKNRLTEIFLHNAPAFLKETSRLIDILENEYLEPTKTMWTEYGSNEPSILGFFDTIGKTLHQGYATKRHLLNDICDFAVPAFNNILDDTDLSPETKQTLQHRFASIVGTARRGFSYTLYTIEGIANGSVNLLSWAAGIVEYAAALGLTIVDLPTWGMDSLFGNPDAPKIIYRDWAHRRVHEGNVAIWEGIEGIIYLNNLTKDPEAMMYFLSGILEEICNQVDEKGIEGAYGYIVGNLLPDFLLCFVGVGEVNMAAKAAKATEAAEKTKATKWGRGAAAGAKTSGEAAKLRGFSRFGELIADFGEWNKLPVFVTPEGFKFRGGYANFDEFHQLKNVQRVEMRAMANVGSAELAANGSFVDPIIESKYTQYVQRKLREGKPPRERLDWKEASDYWLNDSPMARGNQFNETARTERWYKYNEVHLENGKRVDSYDPVAKEIISRKATDLDMIDETTYRMYLNELSVKYSPGTKIRSDKYPELDGLKLEGKHILEIPESNRTLSKINEYISIAKEYGVELRFRRE